MPVTEKDVKRFSLIILLLALAVLAFMIVKPVITAIIGGLILAYVFFPIHKLVSRYVKNTALSAAIVSLFAVAVIFVPLWLLTPIIAEQIYSFFRATQSFDITGLIKDFLPNASEQLVNQISITINTAVGKATAVALNYATEFLVNFAVVALNLLLVAYVFFYTLKEEAKLRNFVSGLIPLNKNQEKILSQQFKDITGSIIYGQIIVGLFQGVLAGIGFFAFGTPSPFVSTILAIGFSIIPFIGPGIVSIPLAVYLLVSGNQTLAIAFLAYNLLFVSTADNFLRARLVSRKTNVSEALVLIGMIGGLFFLGIIGLIVGPLIFAYFITFLKAYKERTLSSFFAEE